MQYYNDLFDNIQFVLRDPEPLIQSINQLPSDVLARKREQVIQGPSNNLISPGSLAMALDIERGAQNHLFIPFFPPNGRPN